MMVFGGGAFGKQSDHEGKALMNGTGALIRKNKREMISSSCPCEDVERRQQAAVQERAFTRRSLC